MSVMIVMITETNHQCLLLNLQVKPNSVTVDEIIIMATKDDALTNLIKENNTEEAVQVIDTLGQLLNEERETEDFHMKEIIKDQKMEVSEMFSVSMWLWFIYCG